VLDSYDERMMVGEIYLPNQDLMTYYGAALDECHLPFNFQLIGAPWDAPIVRRLVDDYERDLPQRGWPNWVLGNHDRHRLASRVGPAQARVATMLLLTLRGTPTCYYGDELGMQNVPIPVEFVQDPAARNQPEVAHLVGRDPVRTPMQWDAGPNAGFAEASVQPWLPLADDYAERNVAVQIDEPESMLSLFRALTALRQSSPALMIGDYASVNAGSDNIFAYIRSHGAERYLMVLNFSSVSQKVDLSSIAPQAAVVLSTSLTRLAPVDLAELELDADEGVVLKVDATSAGG
jgi:alpha-glucosidase